MFTRIRQGSFFLLCAVFATCGLLLPALLLAGGAHLPPLEPAILMLGCIALTAAFSKVRFAFSHNDNTLEVSPATAFIVLAAVVLPPPQAALVALVGSYWSMRRYTGWKFLFYSANMSLATGMGSIAAHTLIADHPAGRLVLPAALLAAAVRDIFSLTGYFVFEEARSARSGIALLRNTPIGIIFLLDIGLPVVAVAMAGPFLDTPLAAFAIVTCAEGLAYVVLRLLYQQHRDSRQNNYLRDTFSRYLPSPVADRLMISSESIHLGGEQREITVLFCDIREFTAWAEKNQPETIIKQLNALLTRLSQAVISTNGTLDKFTGDGLMAFWNAPDAQDDHAVRALLAVVEMLRQIRALNTERAVEGLPKFDIGIGLNTGTAMVGNVGHRDRLNYTAVGDTVNLAARLESATRELECPFAMSESTFLSLPPEMQRKCARMESISVKNRTTRVQLYTLLQLAQQRGPAVAWHTEGSDDELPSTGS